MFLLYFVWPQLHLTLCLSKTTGLNYRMERIRYHLPLTKSWNKTSYLYQVIDFGKILSKNTQSDVI